MVGENRYSKDYVPVYWFVETTRGHAEENREQSRLSHASLREDKIQE